MKHNFLKILALIMTVQFFPACESNLEIEPFTALDGSVGFQTRQDVDAALLGCYSSIQSANYYGLRYWAFGDLYTGTLTHTGTFPSFAQFANRNLLANNVELNNMWNTIYAGINRANNVIASAPRVEDPAFNVDNAVGEARLLRAFHYFNLLAVFGGSPTGFNQNGLGLPIFTTPTLSADDAEPRPRVSEAEVWTQILDDLNFAIDNLNENNGIGRANKQVATALKARMHLVRKEYAEAAAAAESVINSGRFSLLPGDSYANIFLTKNSTETIWELQFDVNNTNAIAFFYYPTAFGGRNEITSSAELNDLHEEGDLRQETNVTTAAPTNKTLKYTRVAGEDNVQIIRLAEMYLIRAEALAWLSKDAGDINLALDALNVIRNRAGLPDFESTDADEVIAATLRERVLEFAHEGHRWLDIRRTGRFSDLGITEEFRVLWPIPEREINTAGGVIEQNPGY
jgi:starch-binding outer membrane protein, SusD/RagB family